MKRFIQWLWRFRYVPGYKFDIERTACFSQLDDLQLLQQQLQVRIRDLQQLREDCRDQGRVIEASTKAMDEMHEKVGSLRMELATAEEEIEDWKRKAVSLRHGKAIWDAANRLQEQCNEFGRELHKYRGTVGEAYEADQQARG